MSVQKFFDGWSRYFDVVITALNASNLQQSSRYLKDSGPPVIVEWLEYFLMSPVI